MNMTRHCLVLVSLWAICINVIIGVPRCWGKFWCSIFTKVENSMDSILHQRIRIINIIATGHIKKNLSSGGQCPRQWQIFIIFLCLTHWKCESAHLLESYLAILLIPYYTHVKSQHLSPLRKQHYRDEGTQIHERERARIQHLRSNWEQGAWAETTDLHNRDKLA